MLYQLSYVRVRPGYRESPGWGMARRAPSPTMNSTGSGPPSLENRRTESELMLENLPRREEGQTMAEYAVTLGVITALVVAAIALLSGNVSNAITSIAGLI
jgi:Flp pilus assembly pilin Flp